jgi:aminoglycoside phosphotransferase
MKNLSLIEAKKILEVELGSKVDSIKDSSFGGDHLIFIAKIKKKMFVLRYSLRNKNSIAIQKAVSESWREKDVKVPKTIIFNKKYLIEECIPGLDANAAKLSKTEKKKVFRELGFQLRKMHSVRESGYGDFISARKGRYKSWKSFCDIYFLKSLRGSLKKGRVSRAEYDNAREIYKNYSPHLKSFNKPTLLHGDLCLPNFMVDKGKFSGIIDLADARCGDPLFDIGTLHQHTRDEDLIRELLRNYKKTDFNLIIFYAWLVSGKKVNSYNEKRWKKKKKQWDMFSRQLISQF